jgi:death on curing protein
VTLYLDLDTALAIAARALETEPEVADYGLLESALARPQATVMGHDAYPSIYGKAAALLHSLTKNHCLVDGNKRLAWLATVVFCYINGLVIDAPDDDAYDFVIAIADGTISEVGEIAARLERWSRPVSRD